MGYEYRCSKADCRQRVTPPKPVHMYARTKCCPGCRRDSLRRDATRKAWTRKHLCRGTPYCDMHYPHRKGSLGCEHYEGPRDPAWEKLNHELGATPSILPVGAEVPF